MCSLNFPSWVIFHIPHDSFFIPPDVRSQFVLNDQELQTEFLKMTDYWTLALYANGIPVPQTVISPVSRLVVDVERFAEDAEEAMSKIGMGVIYQKTHDLKTLRRPLTAEERNHLIKSYYQPHHLELTARIETALQKFNKAVIIDLHSFSSSQLPYEGQTKKYRPEICIGTDSFHSSEILKEAFLYEFGRVFETALNSPFEGALVPSHHYQKDPRVQSVMIETRRDLYENENNAELLGSFVSTSKALQRCLNSALHHL